MCLLKKAIQPCQSKLCTVLLLICDVYLHYWGYIFKFLMTNTTLQDCFIKSSHHQAAFPTTFAAIATMTHFFYRHLLDEELHLTISTCSCNEPYRTDVRVGRSTSQLARHIGTDHASMAASLGRCLKNVFNIKSTI